MYVECVYVCMYTYTYRGLGKHVHVNESMLCTNTYSIMNDNEITPYHHAYSLILIYIYKETFHNRLLRWKPKK
jgi:hypothetical protein